MSHTSVPNNNNKVSSNINEVYFSQGYSWGWNNKQIMQREEGDSLLKPSLITFPINTRLIKVFATGGSHSAFITEGGEVYTFGRNQSGQLGLGDTIDREQPTQIPQQAFNNEKVISVACGDRHSIFITDLNHVFVCGHSFNYQLGVGTHCAIASPMLVDHMKLKKIASAYCGSRHSILVDTKGAMYSAGYGYYGQLGHGDHKDQTFYKNIDVEWKLKELSCREHFNVALSEDCNVYIWGGRRESDSGQESRFSIPRLICYNLNGRRIIQVSASAKHGLCLTSDGSVYSFGNSLNNCGYLRYIRNLQEGNENDKLELIKEEQELAAKKLDLSSKFVVNSPCEPGVVLYKNHFLQTTTNKIVSIACSSMCNYCVTEKGEVMVFGTCNSGELGVGKKEVQVDFPEEIYFESKKSKVLNIIAGNFHAFAFCQ